MSNKLQNLPPKPILVDMLGLPIFPWEDRERKTAKKIFRPLPTSKVK